MSKHWREAASVIVAAKIVFPKVDTGISKNLHPLPVSKSNKSNTAGAENQNIRKGLNVSNFNILALKRSSNISFMPDSYVFPGGNVDPADTSIEWLDLFQHYGVQNLHETFTPHKKSDGVDIFGKLEDGELLKSLSLRITAIRETFEECGILLCRSKRVHSFDQNSKWAAFLSGYRIQEWQKKVQENAKEFISLCRYFECYPDVWSLKKWSNWLTPTHYTKRFNTAFFIVTLDQMPPTSCTEGEIDEIKWSTPQELLDCCEKQEILLPPPQFYELSRLILFSDVEQLASFTEHKNKAECNMWMPVRVKATDGEMTLFPGDDLYPNLLNYYDKTPIQEQEKSLEELREHSHCLHRMEHTKKHNTKLIIKNITPSENEVLPRLT